MVQFDEHTFQMGWFNQQLTDFLECWYWESYIYIYDISKLQNFEER